MRRRKSTTKLRFVLPDLSIQKHRAVQTLTIALLEITSVDFAERRRTSFGDRSRKRGWKRVMTTIYEIKKGGGIASTDISLEPQLDLESLQPTARPS